MALMLFDKSMGYCHEFRIRVSNKASNCLVVKPATGFKAQLDVKLLYGYT